MGLHVDVYGKRRVKTMENSMALMDRMLNAKCS